MDKTPFQEFTLNCIGSTENQLRMSQLDIVKKKKEKKQLKFRYDPKGKPGKIPSFRFANSSGNEILEKNKNI